MTFIEMPGDQGSEEWFQNKLGIPSASKFAAVQAAGEGKTRTKYLRQLAGEIVSGIPRVDFHNDDMDDGNAQEPHLRALYAMVTGTDPQVTGFCKRELPSGWVGASPDAWLGDDGVLEIKRARPDVLIEIMQDARPPSRHIAQCQGVMLVTGRRYCELAIGHEGMPMFRRRILRDSSYQARLEIALEAFNQELKAMVAWVRQYGKEGAR